MTAVKRLAILMPFSIIMYYMCMNKDNYILPSGWNIIWYIICILLGILIRYLLSFFSFFEMTATIYQTFKETGETPYTGKKIWPILHLMLTGWSIICLSAKIYLRYNPISASNSGWLSKIFMFGLFSSWVDNNEWKKIPSFFDIMIGKNLSGSEDTIWNRLGELMSWLGSKVLLCFLPLQNFYTNWISAIPTEIFGLAGYTKELWLEGILCVVTLVLTILHGIYFKNSEKEFDNDDDRKKNNEKGLLYKIFEPLKFLREYITRKNFKIVLPWQRGYEIQRWRSKGIFSLMCVITIIGIILIWRNNELILSFLNGYSILTLINAVILVYLFVKNLINYMWDYGWNEWWGSMCDNTEKKKMLNFSAFSSWIGILLFLFYVVCTMIYGYFYYDKQYEQMPLIIFVLVCLGGLLIWGTGIQYTALTGTMGCAKEGDEEGNDGHRVQNFLKFFGGISGSWAWLMFIGAILLDRIIGLFTQKYSLISVGIVAIINNIIRTIMLFIANFIGFLPYWLGNINAGKI